MTASTVFLLLRPLLGDDGKQQKHDFLCWEFHETDQIGSALRLESIGKERDTLSV